MENRVDLYGMAHKALRNLLFEAASLAARTDLSSEAEARALAARIARLVGWLDEHAAVEDAAIMPELAAIAPELFASLRSEHARVEGAQRELEALARRLETASGPERASLGRKVHERLLRLVAEHIVHMEHEESDGNRLLWAHRTDDELRALQARIRATIPPARAAAWLAVMLPALSLPERAAVLRPLRGAVPTPALDDLLAPARAALGEDWGRTAAAAELSS
jgi:hypothetical protein